MNYKKYLKIVVAVMFVGLGVITTQSFGRYDDRDRGFLGLGIGSSGVGAQVGPVGVGVGNYDPYYNDSTVGIGVGVAPRYDEDNYYRSRRCRGGRCNRGYYNEYNTTTYQD